MGRRSGCICTDLSQAVSGKWGNASTTRIFKIIGAVYIERNEKSMTTSVKVAEGVTV
jgi:hypothetical protein